MIISPEPGIPESFKVLFKELQSLGLDVKVLDENRNEVELMETSEYGNTDLNSIISGDKDLHLKTASPLVQRWDSPRSSLIQRTRNW